MQVDGSKRARSTLDARADRKRSVRRATLRAFAHPLMRSDPALVQQLVSLGIPKAKAQFALAEHGGEVEAAADWCWGEVSLPLRAFPRQQRTAALITPASFTGGRLDTLIVAQHLLHQAPARTRGGELECAPARGRPALSPGRKESPTSSSARPRHKGPHRSDAPPLHRPSGFLNTKY